tara:strand:- start:4896 stop:5249 length:354 start_codon:yes stop_codon:yes gene_type:complete
LAICDPAQTLAFEFFLCDDADELFGVSCGDALTDDDAEMIDDETFEDCGRKSAAARGRPLSGLRTFGIDWKVHGFVEAVVLDVVEHLEEEDEGEFAWPGVICVGAHVERIDADQARL